MVKEVYDDISIILSSCYDEEILTDIRVDIADLGSNPNVSLVSE